MPHSKSISGVPAPVTGEQAMLALRRILESSVFRGSKRCCAFLEFVVDRSLKGDSESLKERTIATEVFGRAVASELSEDSIVRVGAREVRKRLAQYYVTPEGAADPVRIELPLGSYVPVFHTQLEASNEVVLEPPTVEPTEATVVVPVRASARRRWLFAACVTVAVLAALLIWRALPGNAEEFENFWRPAFAQSSPLLIALPHPIVYQTSSRINHLDQERNGSPPLPLQRPIQLPPDASNGSDFIPIMDQYVGFGDAVAAFRLADFLSKRSRPARLRQASKLGFADLRDAPSVLIGAFTNYWSIEVTKSFRYQFYLRDGNKPAILDQTTGQRWSSDKSDDGKSTRDYILIARLPHSQTGGFVIVGAGLTQFGTQEVGRILAEPEVLSRMLREVRADWSGRNLEMVLHTEIVGDTPGPPDLVAWHVW